VDLADSQLLSEVVAHRVRKVPRAVREHGHVAAAEVAHQQAMTAEPVHWLALLAVELVPARLSALGVQRQAWMQS